MKPEMQVLLKILAGNNIPAIYVPTRAEALERVMSAIPEGSVVGLGDSVTLHEIGLVNALTEGRFTLLNPWRAGVSVEEAVALKRQALTADVFVTGTNALTLDGKLVNMDGHGNRVAAMLFGPGRVIVVVGINKIVKDVNAALERIRNHAAPLNVRRHTEFDPMPPCAETGVCSDCTSEWRICNKTTIIERQYDNVKYEPALSVVVVGEKLGL